MRNIVSVFLLVLIGCQTDPQFVLKGQLPDKTYDGELMYLVPIENAPIERVDSAFIVDGTFRFRSTTRNSEIYVIRAKPVLRFNLQELLVVKEPGIVTVNIGKKSSATGTALNDSLQQWKEKKAVADFLYEDLMHQLKTDTIADQAVLKQKADSLIVRITDFHYNFVRNNRNNVVGKFVNKMMGSTFSSDQKKVLSIQ